ncbi:transposase [Neosynechococcus sphagnicola sy1]|uniref:Transposase n=1 Tax=Neosynechococcus sphagnicola sy1 TaxID=1497020 RepID=A0A098TQN6_9CYAN|nr:transposase [Neosynechococcus sphagnicola sy1]
MRLKTTLLKHPLSDKEWAILAPLIAPGKSGGRPRTTDMRGVCNGIYYQLKSGCQWEMLPKEYPPSSTVYSYYRKWQRRGLWEQFNHTLRDQVREQMGKCPQPTAIAADSQSEKTAETRGRCRGLMAVRG